MRALRLILSVLSGAALVPACGADPSEVAAPAYEESVSAIQFGEPVEAGEFSAVGSVALLDGEVASGFCSASLIAPDVVITAAHCLPAAPDGRVPWFSRSTVTPNVDVFDPRLWTRANGWVRHPSYGSGGGGRLRFDLALVFLESPVAGVTPLAVADPPVEPYLVVGAPALLLGYGRTQDGLTGTLHKAKSSLAFVGPWELRFGGAPPNASRCSGDSGGPTLMEIPDGRTPALRLVSVNSYGLTDCRSASTEGRVDASLSWIIDALDAACESGLRGREACFQHRLPELAGPVSAEPSRPAPLPKEPPAGTTIVYLEPVSGCSAGSPGLTAAVLVLARRGVRRRGALPR